MRSDVYDTVIAGAGLAGASAACALSPSKSVLVLEAERPSAGASGVAGGLVNTVMGRRPRLVWHADEALEALREATRQSDAYDAVREDGVVRPARSAEQATLYRQMAEERPGDMAWLSADDAAERWAALHAPHGALHLREGMAVDVRRFVHAMLTVAQEKGACVELGARVTGWSETGDSVQVRVSGTGGARYIECRTLVLCVGQDYVHHPELAGLPLTRIKGQTVRVRLSAPVGELPCLSGYGYAVPQDEQTLDLGSTYEHQFDDLEPSSEQSQYIIEKTARMVPALARADVLETQAGARVKVPNSRYPLLDRLPGRRRIWIFTGLGSKGLLMAPLLARRLARVMQGDDDVWPTEVRLGDRGDDVGRHNCVK